MPSTASYVGPLALPVPAGAAQSALDDPTLSGLGAYLAFCLRFDLNAKLTSLQTGRESDATAISSAVPTGNVFCWNPLKPTAHFTRGAGDGETYPLPALYLWDDKDREKGWSQLHKMRERAVTVAWIFEEAVLPGWNVDRYGLRPAVAGSIQRAISEKYHPAYNARQTIAVQLDLAGEGIVYQGSERGVLSPRPDQRGTPLGSDQPTVRAYPCVMASLLVYERVEGFTALPSEVAGDTSVVTSTGPDPQNPVRVGTRVVPAPPYTEST
jgi:hypothetical protein